MQFRLSGRLETILLYNTLSEPNDFSPNPDITFNDIPISRISHDGLSQLVKNVAIGSQISSILIAEVTARHSKSQDHLRDTLSDTIAQLLEENAELRRQLDVPHQDSPLP